MTTPSIQFNNGLTIPQIGFGTAAIGQWQQDDAYVKDVVLSAIEAGYRHIDTASVYGNERSVGQAIQESGIPREAFFVTTKVWDSEQGRQQTSAALHRSLERLQLDYVDLYLVHWPNPTMTQPTWQAMEQLQADGYLRSLGLSNFRQSDIEQILTFAEVKPVYNQLEVHPYLQQRDLTRFCESQGIVVSCWSPLGSGSWSGVAVEEKPVSDSVIQKIAKNHGVSSAQVILKWDLQQGRIIIPKSETLKNIESNLRPGGFELNDNELAAINALDKGRRYGADPDTAFKDNLNIKVPD
ncbi:aldo/keto reductase [Planctobacterium marinum]|uniref:aldo/keto reductase n=1 Tax=Planctobacterium marinum TaxID=1631968 RepID=UPI001E41D3AB|nr:aldo/keto reductase [Planctobacterium marinum]MCC2605077.1 aldo/keto reductase [Planctobacterium marinum]